LELEQLTFTYEFNDEKTLKTFVVGRNQGLIDNLLQPHSEFMQTYIYAPGNCGKSHLLYAVSDLLSGNQTGMYLSLSDPDIREIGPEVLENTEELDYLLVDDLDAVAGDRTWEIALYSCINLARKVNRCHLIFTAAGLPSEVKFSLNDLRTRLQWGETFYLHPLDGDELATLIKCMLATKGLEISQSVIDFIYRRITWSLPEVVRCAEKLMNFAIENNAKITVPVVKKALGI
jgi:DnaA family protein